MNWDEFATEQIEHLRGMWGDRWFFLVLLTGMISLPTIVLMFLISLVETLFLV